jgi:predicted permease
MSFFDTQPLTGYSPVAHWSVIGRLRPGVTVDQAEAHVDARTKARRQASAPRSMDNGKSIMLMPLTTAALNLRTRTETVQFLSLLTITVGLLLALACTSVTSLLLARIAQRRRELAIRVALGAGPGRIVRLVLWEAALVVGGGAVAGVGVSRLLLESLGSFWLPGSVAVKNLTLAPAAAPVAAFAVVAAIVVTLACGLAPAEQVLKTDLVVSLSARPGSTAQGRSHTRAILVATQVAVAVVLLVGGQLFRRSVERVLSRDLGFPAAKVLVASVTTIPQLYPPEQAESLMFDAAVRIRQIPGVEGVALGPTPLGPAQGGSAIRVGGQERRMAAGRSFGLDFVEPGFLTALGNPLVIGRDIVESDSAGSPLVAVASESFARHLWPDSSALGRVFTFLPFRGDITVVGVAKDGRWTDAQSGPIPCLYMPRRQAPPGVAPLTHLMVRTARLAADGYIREQVRRELASAFPDMPAPVVEGMQKTLTSWLQPQRLALNLFAWFGLIAATVSIVGISAMVAAVVAERSRDVAIRRVLGGGQLAILVQTFQKGAGPLVVGCALGLVGSFLARGTVRAFLLDVEPLDIRSFAEAGGALLGSGLLAIGAIAIRALRAEPMDVLRAE